MRKILFIVGGAAIVAAMLIAAVTTRHKPNLLACKAALEQEWNLVESGYQGKEISYPKSCDGIPASQVEQLAVQVLNEHAKALA